MIQIKLFKLKSSSITDVQLSSINITESGTIVYCNHSLLTENRTGIFNGLINEELIGIDVDGVTELSLDKSLSDLAFICDSIESSDLNDYINQVKWNLDIAPQLIAIVRGEMLGSSLSNMGLSGPLLLNKLSSIIAVVQVGMFKEAWQMFYVLEGDAFHTPERIGRYINLLQSADAIIYT